MFWKVLVASLLSAGLVMAALAAVTVYLHRHLAHGSVTLAGPAVAVSRGLIFVVSGMKPREWAAVHRKHHKFSDRLEDPHSPHIVGRNKVLFWTAGLYHRVTHSTTVVRDYASDLPVDKWDRWIFDRGAWGPALVLPIVQLLGMYIILGFGWHLAWVAFMWPVTIVVFLSGGGIINSLGHTAKQRDPVTDDYSINLGLVLTTLTLGEGNHHNHHLDLGSAKFARHAWRDLGWCVIWVLRGLRLAKVKHVHAW